MSSDPSLCRRTFMQTQLPGAASPSDSLDPEDAEGRGPSRREKAGGDRSLIRTDRCSLSTKGPSGWVFAIPL